MQTQLDCRSPAPATVVVEERRGWATRQVARLRVPVEPGERCHCQEMMNGKELQDMLLCL
jgi:hypothetical protein